MPKHVYEVIPQSRFTMTQHELRRSSSYVTGFSRAEAARRCAEERQALERSGELHRHELYANATRLQGELQLASYQLREIKEDSSMLAAALKPLPKEAAALESWIAQAAILRDAVNAVLPTLVANWHAQESAKREEKSRLRREELATRQEHERARREEYIRQQRVYLRLRQEEDARERTAVMADIEKIRAGQLVDSGAIASVHTAACWLDSFNPKLIGWLASCRDRAVRYEQMEDDLYGPDPHSIVRITFSREEQDAQASRTYGKPRPKAHRRGFDPDLRSRWRKERRLIVA